MATFAGTAGKTYWDEGIESSILALQYAAKSTGHADLIDRANKLQQDLTNATFPVFSGMFIKSDALTLGDDIAAVTGGTNPVYQVDAGIGGVFGVAAPEVEAQVGGDIGANAAAIASDLGSSAADLAASATDVSGTVAHVVVKYAKWLAVALAVLVVLYVVLRARR